LRIHILRFRWNGLSCRDASRSKIQAHRAQENGRHPTAMPTSIRPGTRGTWRDPRPTGSFLGATTGDLAANPGRCPAQPLAQG
jgi:hypothetical protein